MSTEVHPPINSTGINPEYNPDWDYTEAFKAEQKSDMYQGRPIIGRDSPIDGGVYFGTYSGEAIVVDTEKYPEPYEELLSAVIDRSTKDGVVKKGLVLQAVFDTVTERMKYSQKGVNRVVDDLPDGGKISLGDFIDAGVGVCRHQALAVGVLLERMKKDGYISGEVSVDRSMAWSPKGEREGHAWVRYTGSNGIVAILDVAQNKFMLLNDVDASTGWNYLRPEEQVSFTEGVDALNAEKAGGDNKLKGKLLDREKSQEGGQQNLTFEQQEKTLLDALDTIKGRFGEEDQLNLWRYASGILNKAAAQRRGDGQASIDFERQSGQALRALPKEAQAVADDYLRIFSQLDRLRASERS